MKITKRIAIIVMASVLALGGLATGIAFAASDHDGDPGTTPALTGITAAVVGVSSVSCAPASDHTPVTKWRLSYSRT